MPQGYEERFTYGSPMMSSGITNGLFWSFSGTPLLEYESVYTYRSGKRSKDLIRPGNYIPSANTGSLADRIRRRNDILKQLQRDIVSPSVGGVNAFSTVDEGHPFASFKIKTHQPYGRVRYNDGTGQNAGLWDVCLSTNAIRWGYPSAETGYSGSPMGRHTYFSWPAPLLAGAAPSVTRQVVSNASKNALASGLIAGSNPWAPKASLAVTVLELLTGSVPSVLKNLKRYLADLQSLKKTAGSDWLNVQFGWVPLVKDIQDAVDTLFKLHLLLHGSDERRRHDKGEIGKWERFVDVPVASDRTLFWSSPLASSNTSPSFLTNQSGMMRTSPGTIDAAAGQWSFASKIVADYRFSARYHRGARPNSRERGYIEQAAQLLGLELTPAVLWELAPWTWLLDWGSNLGAVATNLSQLDWSNVLLDYAYLTLCVKTEASISVNLYTGKWGTNGRYSSANGNFISQHITSVEKIREQASPFGFSVDWNGLNAFQLSILAALGMSRGK